MSDRNAKDIRKQVRNVVQEILDEVLAKEIFASMDKELRELILKRMDLIHEQVKLSLERIDNRNKDLINMMQREYLQAKQLDAVQAEKSVD